MKIGLLIPCFNRANYLQKCLWSLERADLSKVDKIYIIDDCSTDKDVYKIISDFIIRVGKVKSDINDRNLGIKQTLLNGYNELFNDGYDIVINLDSDAIVRPDFVERLIERYKPGTLLTGFHSTTKNANGTDRHIIKRSTKYFHIKESVGGINYCIDAYAYKHLVKPALEHCITSLENWDRVASLRADGVYCLKESVIQHIGFESTLGHHENPDTADSFYFWDLPTVTLLGVDVNKERLDKAKDICKEWFNYGAVVTVNPPLKSKEEYSRFMVKEAYKFINTEHVLIFQYDGFIHNWQAWDNDWLQYDYIGAPWHYDDGMEVGNGGFSLRSRRLMEIIATDPFITDLHPEDHIICRVYRRYLENKYGIKFAPVEVAEKFAFEGFRQPDKFLKDQFGRHGSNPRTAPMVIERSMLSQTLSIAKPIKKVGQSLIFNQPLSLGDILFLIPMARALMDEGNKVLWPIDDRYFSIAKHFKDIHFVNKLAYTNLPYESRTVVNTPHGKMLPYRFASENMRRGLDKCMESKYNLFGHDHNIWRSLYWERDYQNEAKLIQLLNLPAEFILVNRTFGHEAKMTITPDIKSNLPIVEMRNIDGFTLIDWLGVIEKATEVHASNSSLNYLLELSHYDIPIHLYKRGIWGEVGFSYTRQLWQNTNFIFHE